MKKPKPLTDDEGEVRELLLEDMKRFLPAAAVLPPSLVAKLGIKPVPGERLPAKESITIRLSRDVLQRFRDGGPGWQARIDAALREWLNTHSTT